MFFFFVFFVNFFVNFFKTTSPLIKLSCQKHIYSTRNNSQRERKKGKHLGDKNDLLHHLRRQNLYQTFVFIFLSVFLPVQLQDPWDDGGWI